MKSVTYSEFARAEVRAIVKYYEKCQKGLGREFKNDLEHAHSCMRRSPQAFGFDKLTQTRRYVMRRFPYSVHYLDDEQTITIVAVAHQKRRPGYWLK